MSPFGRNASAQGRFRPFIGTTRNVCSCVWNTCGSADRVVGGGQLVQSVRRAASWTATAAPDATTTAMVAAATGTSP